MKNLFQKVRTWFSKSTEPIFIKLPLFVSLPWVCTQKNFQENLIHKFWEKYDFLKKVWFSRFFWENFTFHKIYELNFFENFSDEIPSQVRASWNLFKNLFGSFFVSLCYLSMVFENHFSQTKVKFFSSPCQIFLIFLKSVPQHPGIMRTNFWAISLSFDRERQFFLKSTFQKIYTRFTTLR